MTVNGLWAHPMEFYINVMQELGITAVRIPISTEWIQLHWNDSPDANFLTADPKRQGKTARALMKDLLDLTHDAHIRVMFDMHRLDWTYISELWYDSYTSRFTSADFINAWVAFLDEFGHYPNIMAIDLLNEPHGRATWGSNDSSTDWRLAAEETIAHLAARYATKTWLYVVEGIGWGKDVSGAVLYPIRHAPQHRLAYSAHNYGRSVVATTPVVKELLWYDWDINFGRVRDEGYSVIIGEYGGRTDIDQEWMILFSDYLIEKNMTDAFFWSLGPNSGDVAGILLDDWTTVDEFKKSILEKL